MAIPYRIDREHRLVVASPQGTLTAADLFQYQRECWSRDDVRGFDELVDMTGVTEVTEPDKDRIRELSNLAARMDDRDRPSKLAIVCERDLFYGLARMFQTYREMNPESTREVRVFRAMPEALAYLGGGEPGLPHA